MIATAQHAGAAVSKKIYRATVSVSVVSSNGFSDTEHGMHAHAHCENSQR